MSCRTAAGRLRRMGPAGAKGADKGIRLGDILQCNRWTDLRAGAGEGPAKGVFVPNQHRLRDYPKSRKTRVKFEANQLAEAERKDICIVPSCVLFEAVKAALGGARPDRGEIEASIAGTRGVLERIPVGGD